MSRPVCVERAFGVAGSDVAQIAVPRRVGHRAQRFQKFLGAGVVGAVLSSTRSAPGWLHSSTGQELFLREVCTGLARGGGARSSCDSHLAWVTDSAVGQLLSLDIFSILGIRIVFLDWQLFDGRKRRSASSPDVANFGRGRKWHWRTDGWTLGKLHLCAYHRAR